MNLSSGDGVLVAYTRRGGRGEDYRRRIGSARAPSRAQGPATLRHRRDTCETLELAGAAAASVVSSGFLSEASGDGPSGPKKYVSSDLGDLR